MGVWLPGNLARARRIIEINFGLSSNRSPLPDREAVTSVHILWKPDDEGVISNAQIVVIELMPVHRNRKQLGIRKRPSKGPGTNLVESRLIENGGHRRGNSSHACLYHLRHSRYGRHRTRRVLVASLGIRRGAIAAAAAQTA